MTLQMMPSRPCVQKHHQQRVGILSSLENAFVPLTAPLPPGLGEDWLYTGRAFAFDTLPVNADWVVVVPEYYGHEIYWRIFLKARFQNGSLGKPMRQVPWNFNARFEGDPLLYEQGGYIGEVVPAGYWIDFTEWRVHMAGNVYLLYPPGSQPIMPPDSMNF